METFSVLDRNFHHNDTILVLEKLVYRNYVKYYELI